MKAINNFLKSSTLPILWTVGYVFVVWAILKFMFNFELFAMADWVRLSHAHLRGLAGFVLGILILGAPAIYISTIIIIIRTKKSLINISLPKVISKAFTPVTEEEPQKAEKADDAKDKKTEVVVEEKKPEKSVEIQRAFAHAMVSMQEKNNYRKVSDSETVLAPSVPEQDNFPIPDDFDDFATGEEEATAPAFSDAPMFKDINFDEDDDNDTNVNAGTNSITEYLTAKSEKFEVVDDLIVTKDSVIAVHDDADFWIADDDFWFASGKQCNSPILKLLSVSNAKKLKPVFYFASTNILDFEEKVGIWKSMGITIVTNLSEL